MRKTTYLVRSVHQGQRELLEDDVSGSIREEDDVSGSHRDSILYRRCLMEVAGISGVMNVKVMILPSKRVTNKF
ncbi:hypothetical protein DVH24_013313 [Malus domestica]|uniref:Uncharacterized protein n=1 Tax=Malus domestica TaxID=3750 RepID=A0A498HMF6_MALDO|nr:hypothetical protein DVH24_013313 [Malus domestica]